MAPTGQWYGKTFTGLSHDSRTLALTYDDGPNDPPEVVQGLAEVDGNQFVALTKAKGRGDGVERSAGTSQALAATDGLHVEEVRVGAARLTSNQDPAPIDAALAALARAGYRAHQESS